MILKLRNFRSEGQPTKLYIEWSVENQAGRSLRVGPPRKPRERGALSARCVERTSLRANSWRAAGTAPPISPARSWCKMGRDGMETAAAVRGADGIYLPRDRIRGLGNVQYRRASIVATPPDVHGARSAKHDKRKADASRCRVHTRTPIYYIYRRPTGRSNIDARARVVGERRSDQWIESVVYNGQRPCLPSYLYVCGPIACFPVISSHTDMCRRTGGALR